MQAVRLIFTPITPITPIPYNGSPKFTPNTPTLFRVGVMGVGPSYFGETMSLNEKISFLLSNGWLSPFEHDGEIYVVQEDCQTAFLLESAYRHQLAKNRFEKLLEGCNLINTQ